MMLSGVSKALLEDVLGRHVWRIHQFVGMNPRDLIHAIIQSFGKRCLT